VARELHGEAADWSVTDHLLAHVVDQLAEANWMFATVNRDEDADPLEYPEPIVRPGDVSGVVAENKQSVATAPSPPEIAHFFS
jgi:hypothetical protein